ncbi:hypothetical protein F5B19DRAFT_498877 [Rostrohypoxylon terebratum]|nr:hypothetical protein F5B19DRAFT_498877 [Rostrohypoxylon terebratum]
MASATPPLNQATAGQPLPRKQSELRVQPVEDFPTGYPRLSAFISSHPSLHLFRRFLRLRARLMLQKQNKLAMLESQLDELDKSEQKKLRLGTLRGDNNTARISLLEQVDSALNDYDRFSERTEKMIARPSPKTRDVMNMQNWIENTSSVIDEETLFLWEQEDLFSLGSLGTDDVMRSLEGPLEDAVFWFRRIIKGSSTSISRDTYVHFANRSQIQALSQLALACVLVFIVFVPVLLLAFLHDFSTRATILMIASVLFVASLLSIVKTKPGETIMAGVAYAAVLVVFFGQ